jgi:hypothetical protein
VGGAVRETGGRRGRAGNGWILKSRAVRRKRKLFL